MLSSRASGVLLHPSSLPGSFAIGDLGDTAYAWIDLLAEAGQSLWQVLPLGPTGYGNSPYASLSAFAGNPLLVSLERLCAAGWLDAGSLPAPLAGTGRTDYEQAARLKRPLLETAALRFLAEARRGGQPGYHRFVRENRFWLDDFALFAACKAHFGERVWHDWERGIALREPKAVAAWSERLAEQIAVQRALQYFFFQQWRTLKAHANAHGVRIIGDIPIFVAADSADVWARRRFFHLDEHGLPRVVAGVPPDYFSATGQRWGNPLYRWDVMRRNGYEWWVSRLRMLLSLVDVIRIDHFRGFAGYWEIPAEEPTAVNGRWLPGPGAGFFQAVEGALGKLPIIAEDLGIITPDVEELRDRFGFPGMKVLQFAFGGAAGGTPVSNPYLPHNFPARCVAYTGTHDNDTAAGWLASTDEVSRALALDYLAPGDEPFHWALIRAVMRSVAAVAVFPLQDVLGLDGSARMNLPGTAESNWEWRMEAGALSSEHAARLREMSRLYERNRALTEPPPTPTGPS